MPALNQAEDKHYKLALYLREHIHAAGITPNLKNEDSRLEHTQQITGHTDPKNTLLCDQRVKMISLDEVEKIGI